MAGTRDWKPLLVALALAIVLQALFVGSFVAALSAPEPDEIPFGVVGPRATTQPLVDAIGKRTGTALDLRRYDTDKAVRAAIDRQDVFGALEPRSDGTATLYVASAAGASVAKLFEGAAPKVATALNLQVTVKDLKPLPSSDPNGLTVFYVALGCIVYGYAGAFISMTAAPAASLRRRLPALAVFSLVGGALTGLIAGPIFDAIHFTFVPFMLIAALAMFTAAVITVAAVRALGQKAMPLLLLVLVILGSPASGGAVAPELLPAFFRFIGQWLPTGAAVSALRNNVYFPGDQHGRPLLVLTGWLVLAAVVLTIAVRRQGTVEPATDEREARAPSE
jgi:hypothetical protein